MAPPRSPVPLCFCRPRPTLAARSLRCLGLFSTFAVCRKCAGEFAAATQMHIWAERRLDGGGGETTWPPQSPSGGGPLEGTGLNVIISTFQSLGVKEKGRRFTYPPFNCSLGLTSFFRRTFLRSPVSLGRRVVMALEAAHPDGLWGGAETTDK